MTKTQGVHYENSFFLAYDVAMGILLKHVIDAAEARPVDAESEWLRTEVSDWRAVACNDSLAMLIDGDGSWSARQTSIFVALVDEACTRLEARKTIPGVEVENWPILDDQRLFTRGETEVETAPIVELGRAIIALVNGSLPESPLCTTWYYGFPDGRLFLPASRWVGDMTLSSQKVQAGGTVVVTVKDVKFLRGETYVVFMIGKSGEAYSIELYEKTDANGSASATFTIPTSAAPGEDWVVTVRIAYFANIIQGISSIRIVRMADDSSGQDN